SATLVAIGWIRDPLGPRLESGVTLQRRVACLARADANGIRHGINEDLAVADLSRLSRFHDRIDDFVAGFVRHHDFDLQLGNEVDAVFSAAIRFLLSFLSPEAAD